MNSSNLNGGSGTYDPTNFAQANELALEGYGHDSSNNVINMFIQLNFTLAGISDSSPGGTNKGTWNGIDGTRRLTWDLTQFTVSGLQGTNVGGGVTNGTTWMQMIAMYPGITDAKLTVVEQTGGPNGDYPHNYPGGVGPTFFYDNFQFIGSNEVSSPPNTLVVAKVPIPGLYVATTPNATTDSANPEDQRQGIETTNNSTPGYAWAYSGTSTYAMTITNFPSATYSNFEAHMYLVPFANNPPTELNPDWAEANIIDFSVAVNSAGIANGQFRYKAIINGGAANENSNLLSLIVVTNPTPLGTWTLTLTGDNVTITSPNSNSGSTNMTANTAANNFSYGGLTMYLGCQANSTNNIGQQMVYSGAKIVNSGVTTLSDNFTTATLNTNIWRLASEDPNGVLQIPPSAAYSLTWNLPAFGFRLVSCTNMSVASTNWHTSALPVGQFGTRGIALIPSSYLATNTFYRLQSP
jgi:hypothetical protein